MTTNAELAKQLKALTAVVNGYDTELKRIRLMGERIKPEYTAQAENRDAVRSVKNFETILSAMEVRLKELSLVKTNQSISDAGYRLNRAEESMQKDQQRMDVLENTNSGLETAVQRLTKEVEELQSIEDHREPQWRREYVGEFVHGSSCSREGDPTTSCPECEPVKRVNDRLSQIDCFERERGNASLHPVIVFRDVYDFLSEVVSSYEGDAEPSEHDAKNLLYKVGLALDKAANHAPQKADLARLTTEELTGFVKDELTGNSWSSSKFKSVQFADVMAEIKRRAS